MAEITSTDFRRVFACLPTGVTVVTAFGPNGPVGMAANSVTSASLDPPLVLVCPAKSSSTWPTIRDSGSFCISVLAEHQEELCRRFAGRSADRFQGVAWQHRTAGPAIEGAVAWIEAELETEHDAGDHTIVVGRVLSLEAAAAARPLVFFGGQYGSVASQAVASR